MFAVFPGYQFLACPPDLLELAMKKTLAIVALLVFVAAPAYAEDGRVSRSALASLGLGGMEVVSDDVGMEVRGMSSSAATNSFSFFAFVIHDPTTNSTFTFSGGGGQTPASDENAGLNATSSAHSHSAGGFNMAIDQSIDVMAVEVFRFQISTFSFGGTGFAFSP